jgi:hypothetical protein
MPTKKSDDLFSNQIIDDLINLTPNWEVAITRDSIGYWRARAETWIDNGYGGRKTSCEASSPSLLRAIEDLLKHTKSMAKDCGHKFH